MRVLVVALLACAACAACDPPAECEKRTQLLDADAWTKVAPVDDPFDARKPLIEADADGNYPDDDPDGPTPHDVRVCDEAYVYREVFGDEQSLTVDTNWCGWATVQEPLTHDVPDGAPMRVRVFYFEQTGAGLAEAHLAMTVNGRALWTKSVPLPTQSDLIPDEFDAPFAMKKGDTLMWHIDNHGINTWNLLELSFTTPIECEE